MTRRERLMATLRGESVDRPPVNFYELNGLDEDPVDTDPYNIYSDPSWKPLIDLTRDKTDRIVMRSLFFDSFTPDPVDALADIETIENENSRTHKKTLKTNTGKLTSRTRRDRDVNTIWTEEHYLKNTNDLKSFLEINLPEFDGTLDLNRVLDAERALGDTGIVMIDTPDPLCLAASLFNMEEYTIIAMTEPELFRTLLNKFAEYLYPRTDAVAKALPGRLWRIYGPEFAAPPYLPPNLFKEYVVGYDKTMIEMIQGNGGFARIHSHGNTKDILNYIVETGAIGLDPIEPPPQGDVELKYVREKYGKDLVLFGNLEASDIENMPTAQFEEKVKRALEEGTSGEGRGFVLLPSSCPYGRKLSPQAMKNYERIVENV
ncbi:uroporphyrinogen decarboxylase family protein [Verrucomicrobiota bacterium]